MDPEGLAEIETALALHPDPRVGPPGVSPAHAPISASLRPGSAPPTAHDLPPASDLERCRSVSFWLGQASPTKRTMPKSTLTNADQVCGHILRLLHDPALSETHRRVLLALALTMPRWLWPEPGKKGQHLPPNARPQLMKERANAFLSNDWPLLIHEISHDTAFLDPPASPERSPGVLTEADHRRLLHVARQGRLTAAWRQLYSHGVAASTLDTQRLLEQKWIPAPAFPTERRGQHLTPADAFDLVHHAAVFKASSTLPHGSNTDVLGWTHESWQALYRQPHGQKLLTELQVLYATGALGREGTDLFNSCLAIPLKKSTDGTSLRPIAIPTVFRKVFARICVAKFRPELQEAARPHQYAAMCADGSRSIALALRHQRRHDGGDQIYLRTDRHNAFNQADRQATLDGLALAHPTLQASQFAWLRHPTHAFLPAWQGGRRELTTDIGIPQGDPLSSLAFSLLLASPLRDINSLETTAVAYADDAVLVTYLANAATALALWQDLLRPLGLTLNLDKLEMWNPEGHAIPEELHAACPGLRVSDQGFRICGLPLDKVDDSDPLADQPWGNDTFTVQFLQHSREALQARLRVLAAFVVHHGPHTEALHIALHILRVNLSSRCVAPIPLLSSVSHPRLDRPNCCGHA